MTPFPYVTPDPVQVDLESLPKYDDGLQYEKFMKLSGGWQYEALWRRYNGEKLRVEIIRGSRGGENSRAVLQIWSPNERRWNHLHGNPANTLTVHKKRKDANGILVDRVDTNLNDLDDDAEEAFFTDATDLLIKAHLTLGPECPPLPTAEDEKESA